MLNCEQLQQEIDKVRHELLQKSYNTECLSDPDLVRKSQELDILISLYQNKKYDLQNNQGDIF